MNLVYRGYYLRYEYACQILFHSKLFSSECLSITLRVVTLCGRTPHIRRQLSHDAPYTLGLCPSFSNPSCPPYALDALCPSRSALGFASCALSTCNTSNGLHGFLWQSCLVPRSQSSKKSIGPLPLANIATGCFAL